MKYFSFNLCIYLIYLLSVVKSNKQFPIRAFEEIVRKYLGKFQLQGIQYYICKETSANLDLFRTALNMNKFIRYNTLSESINAEVLIGPNKTRQNIGIFLDLSCNEGVSFLEKCSEEKLFGVSYSWLMWSDFYPDWITEALRDTNLSVDSDVLFTTLREGHDVIIEIWDVYKIHFTTKLMSIVIASWTPTSGLQIFSSRPLRNNFHGFKMNSVHAIIDLNDTIDKFVDRFHHPDTTPTPRYTISWFLDTGRMYNFSYNYTYVRLWGQVDSSGNWSGMLGILQRGEVELAFSVIHIRKDRMVTGNFITTYVETKIIFVFMQPAVFGSALAVVRPFSLASWLCVAASIPLAAIIARLLSKYDHSQDIDSWSSILEFTIGNLSQQGPNDNMEMVSSRVMALTLFVMSFFVSMYYNAAILNGLLSPAPKSINSLDKLMDSKLSVAISDIAYMKDFGIEGVYGPEKPNRKKLFKKLQQESKMFLTMEEGVERVKNEKFALLADKMLIFPVLKRSFDASQICNMDLIVNEVPKINLGLLMRKNSPYRDIFAQKLLWQEEVGLKQRNYNLWVDSRPPCIANQQSVSIGILALSLAFYMLLAGTLTSALIFSLETLFCR